MLQEPKDDLDLKLELQYKLNDKVNKLLKLPALQYTYKNKKHVVPMQICIDEFYDGLAETSDIANALDRTAIEDCCKFKWPVGIWDRIEWKTAEIDNPTWGQLFEVASNAYVDGGCVDHHYLECFEFDKNSGTYGFFFGS